MKKLTIALCVALCSCGSTEGDKALENMHNYDAEVEAKFNQLKSPVVLVGKDKTLGEWGITVKDSTGFVYTISCSSDLANNIGASRKVGDTLK
jgi:hypothetical protein